ncbi:GntR family transcriptional regulator [Paraburkholderia caribensis]|uniref:GntR family transcriptional regulator n=1 Tax=Paraburkholderia caribensis TaxID=75105 RepID=UPI00071EB2D8|nr:GntR family transcriptional regulator [Paraburkholderia caribensis]ALP68528.1 transcriptional regulator [Paraburkholderia caribensis]AUT57884.1 GntR family transcriptional regulator [Paraburkholderia caribensis]
MSVLRIPKVAKKTAEAQAADVLRESIMSGSILPGSRVTEIQISDEMGLSRATVRAALNQLAKEGLVSLIPYTGWTVVSLSSRDAWELYTLRSSIERLAAQLVASSLSVEQAEVIRKSFDQLVEACQGRSQKQIAVADFSLHKAIIVAARHGRLLSQYELVERQIRLYIRSSDALIHDNEDIVAQHRPIVEAILAGDVNRAGALSEAHNMSEGEKLTSHLLSLEANAQAEPDEPATARGRLRNLKPRRRSVA